MHSIRFSLRDLVDRLKKKCLTNCLIIVFSEGFRDHGCRCRWEKTSEWYSRIHLFIYSWSSRNRQMHSYLDKVHFIELVKDYRISLNANQWKYTEWMLKSCKLIEFLVEENKGRRKTVSSTSRYFDALVHYEIDSRSNQWRAQLQSLWSIFDTFALAAWNERFLVPKKCFFKIRFKKDFSMFFLS